MKIIVLVKLIPKLSEVSFCINTSRLNVSRMVVDPTDLCALEQALKIKECAGDTEITLLSITPETNRSILSALFLRGADKIYHTWSKRFDSFFMDPLQKAQLLSNILSGMKYDIIMAGSKSNDTGSGTLCIFLSELLKIPCVTNVINIDYSNDKDMVAVRKLDRGFREKYAVQKPFLLGVDSSINKPRYIPLLSELYRRGRNKRVAFIPPHDHIKKISNNYPKVIETTQPKPRTKTGPNLKGLSLQDQLRIMRGETKDKKEFLVGSYKKISEKASKKIKEIIQ